MTRTVSASLATHLATGKTRLSRCLLLDLRDGTSLGITDHDTDLSVALGDSPLTTFSASTGVIPSAVSLTLGLDADNLEARGPIGTDVTRAAVLGGRFNRARFRLFDVRWDSPTEYMRLLAGKVSAAKVEGGEFILEMRSSTDAFNQTIGRVLAPYCSNDFGVNDPPRSYCQATPTTWIAQVASVTDDLRFTVTWTDSPAPTAADIRNGTVEFTSGALAGTLPVEIFELTTGTTIDLYYPLVEAPTIGDLLLVTEGCPKTRAACKAFGQILNFRGFPDMPGTDQYLKFPNPGAA